MMEICWIADIVEICLIRSKPDNYLKCMILNSWHFMPPNFYIHYFCLDLSHKINEQKHHEHKNSTGRILMFLL